MNPIASKVNGLMHFLIKSARILYTVGSAQVFMNISKQSHLLMP